MASPMLVRAALRRLTVRTVVLECIGVPVLGGLVALWLQIPDSHAWEFGLSVIFGLALVVGFFGLQTTVVRRVRGAGPGWDRGWLAGILLGVWLLVWHELAHWIGLLYVHVEERAGFWNSRLSAHQRTIFTEPHLVVWQKDAIDTLLWFVVPAIVLPLIVETVSRGVCGTAGSVSPWRVILRVYGRWQLWLTVGLAGYLATTVAERLTAWHPAETVRGELASALWRLGSLYLILAAIGLVTMAIVAELLSRASVARVTDAQPAP